MTGSALVLIKGENGSGKTFIMTMFALAQLNKNILSNYKIEHPQYKKLQLDDLLNISDNTDVFIDEAYNWLESRRSSKSINVFISQIKEQKRKTNSTWYVSEQRPKQIDKRFEEYPNVIITCKTRYPIGSSKDDFVYKIEYDNPYQVVYLTFPYFEARKYFKYFNTKEIIKMHDQDKIEFDMIKNNSDKLLSKIIELAELIKQNNDNNLKYTHDELKWECLQNKIILQYEPFLYLYFKKKYQESV